MHNSLIMILGAVMAVCIAGTARADVTDDDLACLTTANPDWLFSMVESPDVIKGTHLRIERQTFVPFMGSAPPPFLDVEWAVCDLLLLGSDPVALSIGLGSYIDVYDNEIRLPTVARERWIVEVTPVDPDMRFEMDAALLLGLPVDASMGPDFNLTRTENGGVDIWMSTRGTQIGVQECDAWDVSAFLDVVREGRAVIAGEPFRMVSSSLSYGLNPADRGIYDGTYSRFSPCSGALTLSPE